MVDETERCRNTDGFQVIATDEGPEIDGLDSLINDEVLDVVVADEASLCNLPYLIGLSIVFDEGRDVEYRICHCIREVCKRHAGNTDGAVR